MHAGWNLDVYWMYIGIIFICISDYITCNLFYIAASRNGPITNLCVASLLPRSITVVTEAREV